MTHQLIYLSLLSPLHTGATSQEGNLLGIAREAHTDLPYIPSSTIRGRLRASINNRLTRIKLFGPELEDLSTTGNEEFHASYEQEMGKKLLQLEQGSLWIGDASLLWVPVPSLSHGVVWISCPMLLRRWARFSHCTTPLPTAEYCANESLLATNSPVYLKDAILQSSQLAKLTKEQTKSFVPVTDATLQLERLLVLPDRHYSTLVQMSLWRQVKVKLNEHKAVQGGSFRYEEAIPPDTFMYFPWGIVTQSQSTTTANSQQTFTQLLQDVPDRIMQIGGQEGLGRGFVQYWLGTANHSVTTTQEATP